MPMKKPANVSKATSPSKLVQGVIDQNWGSQKAMSPTQAIGNQFNKKTVAVPGGKK